MSPGEVCDAAVGHPLTTAPQPPRVAGHDRVSPGRAVAGAAVAVGGVCLLLGSVLVVSGDPSPGPVAAPAAAPLAPPPAVTEPAPTEPAPTEPAPTPVPVTPPLVPAGAPSPPARSAPPPVARDVVAVTVLNNSNRTGLADRAARRFVDGGWPVRLTGNFRGQIRVTTVYYDPGLEASARALARDVGIARVRPRFPGLPARGVVVVLTREFRA